MTGEGKREWVEKSCLLLQKGNTKILLLREGRKSSGM